MKEVKMASLEAVFYEVALDIGLTVDSFAISSGPVTADLKPFALTMGEPAQMRATVSEGHLAKFIDEKSPKNISNVRVKAVDGKLLVEAQAVLLLAVPVNAVCRLEIVDGQQLFVRLDSVKVLGGGATNLVESQLEKINPVLDVADLPVEARLDRVEIAEGLVTIYGQVLSADDLNSSGR